ncbi:hypothetical protein P170DRAFT_455674 [Aspergillus steynii IBT 23096]|uniref:Multicopper oxidase n=1 Tax=Aspergillus steynii IBT 23096 TaxID=1392250 RepID=A0A2I2G7J9_9EURO|nr:uncharacterized protein P170DRAFT_455674 [Aspergillus steynii IBT 23096]PLB48849.1 hypothetical protein P170DRAFT_455674 [Aspergillus steynii IBT 23096]
MERQSSRRRKPRQLQEESSCEDLHSNGKSQTAEREIRGLYSILFYPLIVCSLIVLVFLYQSKSSFFVLSQPHIPQLTSPGAHDPDVLRPKIELHPEDHVHRDPVTQYFEWTVTSDHLRPDGVLKQIYLINGLFPGPTIEARTGDTLTINVTNNLQEPVSIHWHGLHIQNSMDGVPAVTQQPISPGSTFTYHFTIPLDQSGTFWYHAHSGVMRADGLYGGLVVHAPAPKSTVRGLMARGQSVYEKELLILVGDWYHRPAEDVLAWFMSIESFGNEPAPDSLLINGVGAFNCSMAVPARPVNCVQQQMDLSYLDLELDKGYRLRVVNTGSLAGFTLSFENHLFQLLEVDSINTALQEPSLAAGILYPGQRMDILVEPSQNKNHQSSLTVHLDDECFNFPNPALTPVQRFFTSPSDENDFNSPHDLTDISISTLDLSRIPSSQPTLSYLSQSRDLKPQVHVVYTKIQKLSINHNIPYGFFNHTSWAPQRDPPLPLNILPKEKWDQNQFSISTTPASDTNTEPVWVDLVVNNLDEGGHPFHLHGHHFYILRVHEASIGWGSFNPFEKIPSDSQNQHPDGYDFSRAMFRDTVYIPRRGHAVLRFRATNPGVWMFHCHIVWHLASGMAMLVHVEG